LVRLKIERAQYLLATTGLPLKQIAALAGFAKPSWMSETFRRHTGQMPTGYRRSFLPPLRDAGGAQNWDGSKNSKV
jgi:transcriptional regulator GlxA family with amidase domain